MFKCKVRYVFPMVVVFKLPQAEFGLNDHRDDAPRFIIKKPTDPI